MILMLLLFSFSRRLTNAILGFAKKLLTRFHRQKLYDKLGASSASWKASMTAIRSFIKTVVLWSPLMFALPFS